MKVGIFSADADGDTGTQGFDLTYAQLPCAQSQGFDLICTKLLCYDINYQCLNIYISLAT